MINSLEFGLFLGLGYEQVSVPRGGGTTIKKKGVVFMHQHKKLTP